MTMYWVAAGFTVWCLWLLKAAATRYGTAGASLDWPSAPGRMTDVRLWGLRNIEGTMKDVERLAVRYVYEVDGREHEGSAAAFYSLVYPATLEFAERHPVGAEVEVRYNPANPSESVIMPGPNPEKPFSDLVLAGIGVVVGAAVTLGLYTGAIG